jgi:hypothetical protein
MQNLERALSELARLLFCVLHSAFSVQRSLFVMARDTSGRGYWPSDGYFSLVYNARRPRCRFRKVFSASPANEPTLTGGGVVPTAVTTRNGPRMRRGRRSSSPPSSASAKALRSRRGRASAAAVSRSRAPRRVREDSSHRATATGRKARDSRRGADSRNCRAARRDRGLPAANVRDAPHVLISRRASRVSHALRRSCRSKGEPPSRRRSVVPREPAVAGAARAAGGASAVRPSRVRKVRPSLSSLRRRDPSSRLVNRGRRASRARPVSRVPRGQFRPTVHARKVKAAAKPAAAAGGAASAAAVRAVVVRVEALRQASNAPARDQRLSVILSGAAWAGVKRGTPRLNPGAGDGRSPFLGFKLGVLRFTPTHASTLRMTPHPLAVRVPTSPWRSSPAS